MGLFDLFSTDNEKAAAGMKIAGINQGLSVANDAFGKGRTAATQRFDQALTPFQSLFTQGGAGTAAYGDAVGLGGPEGIARATANFQALPGYQAGLTGGLDAIDRRAASRGMLGSGNTNIDTAKFATDYANRNYGDYVNRLSPYFGQQQGAAAGMAGVNTGLGGLLDQSFRGQGQLGYQANVGIGDANAAAELAKDATGQNILGSIFKVADLGAKFAGLGGMPSFGGAGGGNGLSNMYNYGSFAGSGFGGSGAPRY